MHLFGSKKKTAPDNQTVDSTQTASQSQSTGARVKVLGSGCKKCNQLEEATKAALEELHMNTSIEHVTDFAEIARYGVMTTPALVIDETVLSYGKVLKKEEIVALIQKLQK